jgi:hypothetical protein
MVLFQNCVWWSHPLTKMAAQLYLIQYLTWPFGSSELNQRLRGACNRSPGLKLLSITTQLHCGGHLGGRARLPDTILEEDHPMTIPSKLILFQKYVRRFGPSTKMAPTAELSFSKKSSCLEPVTQLEPNFDKIVIWWSSSKFVSGGPALWPRWLHSCT